MEKNCKAQYVGDCGVRGLDYGIISFDEDGDTVYVAGRTCQNIDVKPLFDSLYSSEINGARCGLDSMYTVGRQSLNLFISDIFTPQIFVVDTNYMFKDSLGNNLRKLTQNEIESIQKHEEGHKRDMECIAKKLKSKKVLFDGCFCKEELRSYVRQELEEINIIYDNMLHEADSIYHFVYGNSGYPAEEERYDCVY